MESNPLGLVNGFLPPCK